MNLNEAAEIVRRNSVDFPGQFNLDEDRIARFKLTNTMLSELDQTPISGEALLADGWGERGNVFSSRGMSIWTVANKWYFHFGTHEIKTIGQARTLLRVMGGGE